MKRLKLAIAVIVSFLLLGSNACSVSTTAVPAQATTMSVRIIVTQNFGQGLILDQILNISGKSNAMETLQRVAQVETTYGGGFVNSINGIRSKYAGIGSSQQDWFFYINGMESNTGALDYNLHPGDIEQWDFHNWSYQQFVPAIISSYPQPFLSGFGSRVVPTLVVYEAPFVIESELLVDNLKQMGISQISSVSADRLSKESQVQSNLIIIAGPQNSIISELSNLHKKLGFYAYIETGELIVLDGAGNPSKEYSQDCGLIQATQNPWNPNGIGAGESVVWMITGTDVDGVRSAANTLINNRNELSYAFATIISEGITQKIP